MTKPTQVKTGLLLTAMGEAAHVLQYFFSLPSLIIRFLAEHIATQNKD